MRACMAVLLLLGAVPEGRAAGSPAPRADQAVAIEDVAVIPMDRERVLEHQTVVVQDGRIAALGPARGLVVPPHAVRVDGRGRFLIPGLTDAHVHLYSDIELPLYLANGVTTVYNLHGLPAHLAWRRQVAEGRLVGPRIFSTGPSFNRRMTPGEAVRAVDEQAAAGYDGVKIYNQVGRAEYPALIAEARARRLLLMGHVAREPGYELTVASGQSIAHAEEILYSFFDPAHDDDVDHVVLDAARIPEAVRLAREAGIFVIPTLSTYRDIIRQATDVEAYLGNPELAYLAPWVRAQLAPSANKYVNRYRPEQLARMRLYLEFQRTLVKALAQAGVPLLAGTDSTQIGPMAGFAIHEEIAELVGGGLTPFQALQAATTNPARYFRREGEEGIVAPGQRADLVLLEANPLADPAATRRVAGVVAGGRWYEASALKRMVEDIPARFGEELDRCTRDMEGADPAAVDAHLAEHDPLGLLAGEILARVAAHGAPDLVSRLRRLRAVRPHSVLASEEALNILGYRLYADQPEAAVAILRAVTEDFPTSSNAFDSLGELLARSGDTRGAVAAYAHALELEPEYANAAAARAFVEAHPESGR